MRRDGRAGEGDADQSALRTVASSQGRGWEGIEVEEVIHQVDDFALPAAPHHLIVVHLDHPIRAVERRRGRSGLLREGSLTLLPAGAPTAWHLDRAGDLRHLHLHLATSLLGRVAAEVGLHADRVELVPCMGASSPAIEQVGLALLRELQTGALGGRLLADSLATLLAVHLLRDHTANRQPPAPRRATLAGVPLRRVTAFIEAHLADDVGLRTLAAEASLSPYHFCRLFRDAVGSSPHQYLTQRRVERAKHLLRATDWSLAAIAREVGFANGSHLALHFRHQTGVTPRTYRTDR